MKFYTKWIIFKMVLTTVSWDSGNGTGDNAKTVATSGDTERLTTSVAKPVTENTTQSVTNAVVDNITPLTATKAVTETTGKSQTRTTGILQTGTNGKSQTGTTGKSQTGTTGTSQTETLGKSQTGTQKVDGNTATQQHFTDSTFRSTDLQTRKHAINTSPNSDDSFSIATMKMTPPSPTSFYYFFLTMTERFPTTAMLYYFNPDLQTMENYIKTDKSVLGYLAGFDNEYQRNVVETQLKICPYVPLCNFTLNVLTDQLSCCEACSCEPACLATRTCCPNLLHQRFSDFNNAQQNIISNTSIGVLKNPDTRLPQCISKHLTVRPFYVQQGIYAIAGCPGNAISELQVNCTRPYSPDIRFDAFLPVYSNNTLEVFRNQFCAICNGINITDIVFFQPTFSCSSTETSMYDVASEKDITELVFAIEECDITFGHVDMRLNLNYCDYSISICNVTGLWKTYEAETEHACLAYRSLFHHEQYIFQNVFCALCNGMSPHTVTCYHFHPVETYIFSFSGLMKLDHGQAIDATKVVGDYVSECSEKQVFDSVMEECKDLYCSQMRILQGGTCVNVFEFIQDRISYSLSIRFLPVNEVSLIDMFDMEQRFYDSLRNLLTTLKPQLLICDIVLTYTSTEKYRYGHSRQLQNSVLSSADARISLQRGGVQKPWLITEEILNLHGSVLSINNNFNKTVNFVLTLRDSDDRVFNVMNALVNSPTVFNSLVNSVNNTIKRVSIMSEYSVPSTTGLTITPSSIMLHFLLGCPATEKNIYVLRFLSCPKVNMSKQNYLWTEKIDGITVGDIDINSFEYYHIDQDHIILCADLFMKIVSSLLPERKLNVETIVSVVSSVLSIVALFVAILVYCILPELRKTVPGKNSLSLMICLFTAQILLLVGSLYPFQQYSVECKVIGFLIHFSWLCSIFWMNVCTYHMFRALSTTKLVSHRPGWKKFVFYSTYVLIASTVFVATNVFISISVSGQLGYGGKFCYITSQTRILVTFVLPALLVICINLSMFFFVIIRINRSTKIKRNVQNERNELVIFAKLSTITGITWVFGFLYAWTNILVFSFIFIILNASQGVFIMAAFVVNRRVLSLCKTLTKSKTKTPLSKTSSNKPTTVTTVT